jgi:hypothetical protein
MQLLQLGFLSLCFTRKTTRSALTSRFHTILLRRTLISSCAPLQSAVISAGLSLVVVDGLIKWYVSFDLKIIHPLMEAYTYEIDLLVPEEVH